MKTDFKENIDKLIKGTLSGKIFWTKLTGKAYVWRTENSEGSNLNVIVQKMGNKNNEIELLFRLYEVETKISLIDLYARESKNKDLFNLVLKLFNIIEENIDIGRNDILGDLLKDI
jgi:hypothetical protein